MTHTMPIAEARNKLTTLPEELEQDPDVGAVTVTRHGKPVLAIMSWDLYETITETLEIMSDPVLMAAIRQSIKEIEAGQTISWEQAKQELGWSNTPTKF